ncbi:MAG: TIGR04551 family protein [Bradymonadales bacterium]|nr:TIGR04551 family protein [Bradymonadales bacterium]
MKKASLFFASLCCLLIAATAFAQGEVAERQPSSAPDRIAQADQSQEAEPAPTATVTEGQLLPGVPVEGLGDYVQGRLREPLNAFPYVEHRGYFRFRTDNFWNLDLNTRGTSPILPPLEATNLVRDSFEYNTSDYYDSGANLIAGANIRLRYHPIVHITDGMRLHLELDILDNLVLGSTPDGYSVQAGEVEPRFDTPIVFFSQGQRSANEDLTFSDAVEVRQLFAEMEIFGILKVGRMADDWGLGILANGGGTFMDDPRAVRTSFRGFADGGFDCTDCDFGDITDRVSFTARILPKIPLYLGLSYDWVTQGSQSYLANQTGGQARDLSEIDDAVQWVFTVMRTYLSDREILQRNRQLYDLRQPILEGGARLLLRNQTAEQGEGGFVPNDLTTAFQPRQASVIVPDLWARFLYVPKSEWMIRLELEAAAVFGSIEGYQGALTDQGIVERDILQFGLAFESDFQFDNLYTGFNAGFATGRSPYADYEELSAGWGILDRNTVTHDEKITNFIFDRDYVIDMIMFREIIGAITNTVYFNPYLRYDFFREQASALGFRIDGIYAHALEPAVTPGGEAPIGLEGDAMLFYRADHYQADIGYGLFLPLGALNGGRDRPRIPAVAEFWNLSEIYDSNVDAGLAHTLQVRLTWAF